MQLYIDANIYLEYFRENSAERLAALEALVRLIESGKVSLLLPDQTKDEYYRNRRTVAEVTRNALVKQSQTSSLIPAIYDKKTKVLKDIEKNTKALCESYKKLIAKHDKDVEQEKTDADILIKKLFSLAKQIQEDKTIIESAYHRYMKGNPPRKSDHSYGDAITWESLLKESIGDDLVIVTKDTDYTEHSKSKKILKHYLYREWKNKAKRGKNVSLYTSLGEFVNTLAPKKDQIKKEVIQKEKQESVTDIFRPITGGYGGTNSVTLGGAGSSLFAINGGGIGGSLVFNPASGTVTSSTHLATGGASVIAGGYGGTINKMIQCPFCNSHLVYANTVGFSSTGYLCANCQRSFVL